MNDLNKTQKLNIGLTTFNMIISHYQTEKSESIHLAQGAVFWHEVAPSSRVKRKRNEELI